MNTPDDDLRAATRIPISLGKDARKAAGRAATRAGLPMATWIASLVVTELHAQGHLQDGRLTEG